MQPQQLGEVSVCPLLLEDRGGWTKEGLIQQLVASLANAGHLPAEAVGEIRARIGKRELLGSTGIGRGLAIPHARHPGLDRQVGVLAVTREGVDFESLDGEPVYIIVLLVFPDAGLHSEPIRAPVWIRHLRQDEFCRRLREARSQEELREVIVSAQLG